jgi:hypothetical protein
MTALVACSGSMAPTPSENNGAGGQDHPTTTDGAAAGSSVGTGGSLERKDAGNDARVSTAAEAGPARSDARISVTDARRDGPPPTCNVTWPTATATQSVSSTIRVSGTYDGMMARFAGAGALGTSGQAEHQDPLFQLAEGAVLKNVILGNPAADGVHCSGNCTLQNVWWEDVGEDAATLEGSNTSQVMTIDGGGARHAADKVFQHNGPGTMVIQNFYVEDFGKLYRSCGNCSNQYPRHVVIQDIVAVTPGSALAGVNANYGDTANFARLTLCDQSKHMTVCQRYTGNDTGAEPPLIGSGADGTNCIYSTSDITWLSP